MSYQGRSAVFNDTPYTDPNPLPSSVPPVDELGTTSAPLKSASFFIGQHCKDVNGPSTDNALLAGH
jgi:NADH dehydrogenase (ubiquinone) 1 alpha subcomplex subunit 8